MVHYCGERAAYPGGLVVAEATFGDVPAGIYDLFRIENGKIAEHWDTLQAIPPRDEWKNNNGKF